MTPPSRGHRELAPREAGLQAIRQQLDELARACTLTIDYLALLRQDPTLPPDLQALVQCAEQGAHNAARTVHELQRQLADVTEPPREA